MKGALKKIAVIGAAGKMGRGISLLLLEDLVQRTLLGEEDMTLALVDASEEGLRGLRTYLETQLGKFAEKQEHDLRGAYPHMQGTELQRQFVQDALSLATLTTDVEASKGAEGVFEAVLEDIDTKVALFKMIKGFNGTDPYFFTNTSSIPISALDREANLKHRIIGFHFYNPPAVQKLVEVITTDDTDPKLKEIAQDICHRLHKVVVPAHDVAGFIGNGQFMRDILFACDMVDDLVKERGFSFDEGILAVNRVTQDFMLRPMGIFQLLDYVGWDVCQKIMIVMKRFIPADTFDSAILQRILDAGITGGQFPDGSQKDGIFRYEKGRPAAIYSIERKRFVPLTEVQAAVEEELGPLPEEHHPWKVLVKDEEREAKLKAYFEGVKRQNTLGSRLTRKYLIAMKKVAEGLVQDGVAEKTEDVNTVMKKGFFHLYGPVNEYC